MSNPYQVPKVQVGVDLFDSHNQTWRSGFLHVSSVSRFGYGRETVEEYLREAGHFFPFNPEDHPGHTELWGIHSTLAIRERAVLSEEGRTSLEIHMRGGWVWQVWDFTQRPPHHERLLDYLNGPDNILLFRDESSRPICINRSLLEKVVIL